MLCYDNKIEVKLVATIKKCKKIDLLHICLLIPNIIKKVIKLKKQQYMIYQYGPHYKNHINF